MAADATPEEPYVHPYILGRRVEDMVKQMKQMQADMEDNAMMAVAYTLTTGLLLDLMPHLMEEHRRMAAMVDRDPAACTAVFLRCDRSGEPFDFHEDHFDRAHGMRPSIGTSSAVGIRTMIKELCTIWRASPQIPR